MTNKQNNQQPEQNGGTDNLAKWIVENKKVVIGVFITALIVGGIFAAIDHIRKQSYENQWSKIFIAEMAVANGGDETAYAPLEDFANKNKKKPAGVYANFVLATALMQQGEYLKAEVFYKQALEYANPEFAAMIMNTMIANSLQLGDYERTVQLADEFIANNPTDFSVPQITLYKAFALELSGKLDEAKKVYQSIMENYPQTYDAAIATAKLTPAPQEEPKQETKKESKKGSKKK
ncbi:MAG: tetratricopeptide repeat protein [Elusimicrobiaceae bacterium]|nr:tetratricopeptide repeat protein [Elusimicrobiaceae bacterium]